jgi:hypothetical protein
MFSGDRAIRPVGYGLRHVAHKLDYKNLKLSWQQQQYMTLSPQPSRPPQACSAHIMLDIPETAAQAAVAASAVAASDGGALPVVAWVVVGAATVACFVFMGQAFTEAETAIKRRDEGERRKQQEDEAVEAARKQKIKDMFERL